MKKYRITSIPQTKKLNTYAEGGDPCPDGYRKNYLGTDCIPMEAPEQTNDEEWYRNWYANRTLQDPQGQQLLETARPNILKRAEKFPEEEWYVNPNSTESGSFEPMTGKITLNRGTLDSNPFLKNEVKFHEKGHYLTSPSMLDPEADTVEEVGAHPIQQLRNYEADIVEQALKARKDVPRKDRKYYDYLKGKGKAKPYTEEISKNIMQARRLAGFKPGQVITDEDINNFYKQADEKGWTNPDSELFVEPLRNLKDYTKDPEQLKMLFNKLAANESEPVDEFQPQTARYGGSLSTYAGGGSSTKCADDEKWDERQQRCVKMVKNLSESTHYSPEGKKIQTNLFQKLKDARDAYQNFTQQNRGKKYRLNDADSASSIEQLRKGIQLYKDEYAKEQEQTKAELKKLENLKSKAALKGNTDIQNLNLKDLNTVKGKMKIEDAIRNSSLDSGTIAALYKGFGLDEIDANVKKGSGSNAQYSAKEAKAEWKPEIMQDVGDYAHKAAMGALGIAGGGALSGAVGATGNAVGKVLSNPFVSAPLSAYGVYDAATNTLPEAYKDFSEGRYLEGLGNTALAGLDLMPGAVLGDFKRLGKAVSKGGKNLATKADNLIYPTRVYRSEGFAVDPKRFSTTDEATKKLAEKIGKKGEWATKDLEEAYLYLRGLGFDESQGLLSGKDAKFTEYKLPFWKKDISADPDVVALKKLQGSKLNSSEYIVPGNTALDRFLYPRRTNIIKGIPEAVKSQKIYPPGFPEGVQTYFKGSIPMDVEAESLASPAYKYVEDQLNAVTGHQMPMTHEWNSGYFPIKDWQQPQFAPNEGVGKFTRFSSSLPGSPNAGISGRLKQFFDRPPGPLMLGMPTGSSGNMVKKNMNYYKQLLDSYDGKKMSISDRKFYNSLIETGKKQDGMVTEAQFNELKRLETGNFDFGKRGYNKESLIQVPNTGVVPPPKQAGFINFKGAFQKYPKGPLTEEEIIAYKNSPQYKEWTKQHEELVNKYGDSWTSPNFMEENLQKAIATGDRTQVNPIIHGGRNWNATDYTIAGLAGLAYPGAAAVFGTAFSPPPVKSKVLKTAGITGVPGGLSSKDTIIDITNAPMDFAKVNQTKDGKIIIGGEFIENANNSVRTAKDWLNANDTYSDKKYPSKSIQSFYGVENGKFKVGKASDFDPNTEIVPRRFGAKNISKAVMNDGEMRIIDKNGDPIYQNTPNTGKFILYSPSTKKAQFTYINSGKSGVAKVNDFLKKNKDAQYIHLDNGRYEYYGLNPEGLTKQDFESYYHQDLGREGTPGYNLIIKKEGGATNNYIELDIPKSKIKEYIDQGYIIEKV
jgi:hypothetical protein